MVKFRSGEYETVMIGYFDAGNTRLKVWVCNQAGAVLNSAVVNHHGDPHEAISNLAARIKERPSIMRGTTVLGPALEQALAEAVKSVWGCTVEFARAQYRQCGIVNAYGSQYATLGTDRWLALLGYGELPAERPHACVVDCGTAVTVDILCMDGVHKGGYILPGLCMMAAALQQNTSGVRYDSLDQDGVVPGKSTAEAVTHGAMKSITALIDSTVMDSNADLVLTGGDALRIAPFLKVPYRHEPLLLLKGLQRYFAEAGIT